jgi:hypothetical protein
VTAPAVTLVALGGLTATNPANKFRRGLAHRGAINLRDVDAIDLLAVTVGAGRTLAINSGSAGHAARRRHHQRRPDLDR